MPAKQQDGSDCYPGAIRSAAALKSPELPIRQHDVIACPPGGPEVANQIINTGTSDLRYLALSTLVEVEACEYPDSQKVLIVAGPRGARGLRRMFRAEDEVEYYEREDTRELPR